MESNNISIPIDGLVDGANKNVKIYIPKGSNYPNGYTWASYRDLFVYYEK